MSDNVIELLQSSIEFAGSNNKCFKEFIESCVEHGAFNSKKNIEAVIKIVNTSLNSQFDKEKGLIILLAFLSQTSIEAFSNNAVSWMVNCNSIIHQKGGFIDGLSLKVLTKLIKLSVKFPEVSKEAAKQVVPKFLLDHVRRKTDPQVSLELLGCLKACISEYAGPSGEFRADIVKLLLSTVEARSEVVRAAAQCFSLVARIGGGGKQGVLHKTAWQGQQLSLVSLLHSLLNKIYEHINCLMDTETAPTEAVQLSLEPVTEKNTLYKTWRLATQFTSVAQFLQAMLLEEFPVAKSVAPNAIFDVITHAQKPTHAALGTSREVLAVVSVLPSIQVAALRLLESLILCLGRNLVPWGGLVCYFCSQVIVWTQQQHSDWPYAMDKPYNQTRLAAYCCLHSWLSVAGAASQVETLVDKSLTIMLSDIHNKKPTVRLRVGSKTSKGKKKQQMLVSQENRSEKLDNSVANCSLCEQALLTLSLLVRSAALTLKPDAVVKITGTVLTLVTELPIPYSDANCHNALYQLLLTLCLDPHPTVAPPLAAALTGFTVGLHHPLPQVKTTCLTALSCLEKIVHPTAATLNFPLQRENQLPLIKELSEESEVAECAAKRRKIDISDNSNSIISITLDSSDNETLTTPMDGITVEKDLDEEVSDGSEEIVQVFPATIKCLNVQEEDSEKPPHDNGLVVIEEETKNGVELVNNEIEILPNNEEKSPDTDEVIDAIGLDEKKENKAKFNVITSEIKNDTINDGLDVTDDVDVNQMLMDFNDEVPNEYES